MLIRGKMLIRRYLALMGLAIGIMFLASCAPGSISRLETDYGTSLSLAKSGQILNPEAGEKPEPVYGLGGQAAVEVLERYKDSFKKPTTAPSLTLKISGGQ